MQNELKIELIKVSDLAPGDMVLIKCPKEIKKDVIHWANSFFPRHARIGIVYESMEFEVIKEVKRGE